MIGRVRLSKLPKSRPEFFIFPSVESSQEKSDVEILFSEMGVWAELVDK